MNSPPDTSSAERPAVSDAELLTAHINGDPHAFSEIVRRHRDRMWAVALRTLGDPDEAADAVQDAFVSAYRKAGTFRGEAAVTTWLHRVIVNACLDRLRAAKVRRAEALPDDLDEHVGRGSLATATAGTEDPADRAVTEDRRRQVLDALATLPAEQRAALVLVDMEGYPVAEAAEMLDCAVGTVKSRCSRGRARLAVLLGVLAPGSDPEHPPSGNPDAAPPVRSTRPRGPPTPA